MIPCWLPSLLIKMIAWIPTFKSSSEYLKVENTEVMLFQPEQQVYLRNLKLVLINPVTFTWFGRMDRLEIKSSILQLLLK